MAPQRFQRSRVPQQVQHRRMRACRALHLFELELVAPGDRWTPDDLIDGNDDRNHHSQSHHNGPGIAGACGRLQIGSKSWQTKVTCTQDKHFAGHQEEPTAGD